LTFGALGFFTLGDFGAAGALAFFGAPAFLPAVFFPAAAAGAGAGAGGEMLASDMGVVDWQVFSMGLGATELAQFMCNLQTVRRRNVERDSFQLYVDTLRSAAGAGGGAGAHTYSIEQMHLHYRACGATKMFGMVCIMLSAVDVTATEIGQKLFEYFSDNVYNFMVDNKSLEAVRTLAAATGASPAAAVAGSRS